jgi:hypothetical protein
VTYTECPIYLDHSQELLCLASNKKKCFSFEENTAYGIEPVHNILASEISRSIALFRTALYIGSSDQVTKINGTFCIDAHIRTYIPGYIHSHARVHKHTQTQIHNKI